MKIAGETHQSTDANHNQIRRLLAGVVAAACALNLYGGISTVSADEKCEDTPDAAVLAQTTYNLQDGSVLSIDNELVDEYSIRRDELIASAVNNSLFRLSVSSGDVTSLSSRILMSEPQNSVLSGARPDSGVYDNDAHCGTKKEVILETTIMRPEQRMKSLFSDPEYTHITVVHEAVHGLNNEWWMDIQNTEAFQSPMEQKIYNLQTACDDVNRWLAYKNTGRMIENSKYENDISVNDVCSTDQIAMDTEHLREIFRCVNEGNMLQEARNLNYAVNLGHPWSNPTELASSAIDVLHFDPEYLVRCLMSQDTLGVTVIKRYVAAVLDLSFANRPELENVLRLNPKTAAAIDFIRAAA